MAQLFSLYDVEYVERMEALVQRLAAYPSKAELSILVADAQTFWRWANEEDHEDERL